MIGYAGKVGIGTPNPGAKLEVAGQVKITGGTPAGGEVLTSDGTGLATWEPTASGVPSGAVMFFNLATCPSGWTEFTAARGRYLVGLPLSGELAGSVGTPLTNLENRTVGQHTHPISDPGHTHSETSMAVTENWLLGGGTYARWVLQYPNTGSSTTGITILSTGTVSGTNAPYIQLLVCQKN